jgi:WD40 repeat protein
LVVGLGVFLVVAIGLSGWALNRSQVADENAAEASASLALSESQRLALEANHLLLTETSSELAALLSIQALMKSYSPTANDALVQAANLPNPQRVYEGYKGGVSRAQFSPDGKRLLASVHYIRDLRDLNSVTGTLTFGDREAFEVEEWDAETGAQLRNYGISARACGLYSPDGRYVLTCEGNAAKISDATTGQNIRRFVGASDEDLITAAFSPDSKYVLTSDGPGGVQIWEIETGKEVQHFGKGNMSAYKVMFSPDGKYVVIVSNQSTGGTEALVWDRASVQQIRRFTFSEPTASLVDLEISPDGKYFLTAETDNIARLWDATKGNEIRRFSGHSGPIQRAVFSPDGSYVLSGSYDQTARLWDVRTGNELRVYSDIAAVTDVALSQDGKYLLTSNSSSTRLWSAQPTTSHTFAGHDSLAWASGFSQDQRYVITSSNDNTIWLWNRQTGEEVRRFRIDSNSLETRNEGYIEQRLAFRATLSADNKYLLALLTDSSNPVVVSLFGGHSGTPPIVVMWDVDSGQQLREVPPPYDELDQLLGTGAADWLRGSSWEPLKYDVFFYAVGYGGTGSGSTNVEVQSKLIKESADNSVLLLKPSTVELPMPTSDQSASPQSREVIQRLRGHTGPVLFATLSADSKYVLTGSEDWTARLWDANTGRLLRVFLGHTAGVTHGIFSSDNLYILTGSNDGTVRLWANDGTARPWDTDYYDTIKWACSRLARDLTDDERKQYGITDKEPTCPKP